MTPKSFENLANKRFLRFVFNPKQHCKFKNCQLDCYFFLDPTNSHRRARVNRQNHSSSTRSNSLTGPLQTSERHQALALQKARPVSKISISPQSEYLICEQYSGAETEIFLITRSIPWLLMLYLPAVARSSATMELAMYDKMVFVEKNFHYSHYLSVEKCGKRDYNSCFLNELITTRVKISLPHHPPPPSPSHLFLCLYFRCQIISRNRGDLRS